MEIGIIGLPNVGKSTLFNALLKKQQALVANYPFATIEPNVGIVPVPDDRLYKLADVVEKETMDPNTKLGIRPPLVPATVQFVDIAGLVKGAAEGAGLGNKFLSHIREVDLICEVVRAFSDENIIREGSLDPKSDREVINTELILADLQTLEKADSGKRLADRKEQEIRASAIKKLKENLNMGKLASEVELSEEELEAVKELQLLTFKRFIYVVNASLEKESMLEEQAATMLGVSPNRVCVIDAKVESELVVLSSLEQVEYLKTLGVTQSGLDKLIKRAYDQLGLISFLTAGEKEVRAWTIKKGTKAPQAAGVIHTDFEKGFIKADVVAFADFVHNSGWKKNRELGKVRSEGKEYEMQNGEVVEFKVNV